MHKSPDFIAAKAACIIPAFCIGLILIPTAACHGPSPDWNGTWKLNPARSSIPGTGPTLTISITPDGMYHSTSGGVTANFGCDGKEYQSIEILKTVCTQKNSTGLETTNFRDGSKMSTSEWELSPDGKELTIRSTRFFGDRESKENHYVRTSGSTGFAGGWRNVNPFEMVASIRQISMGSNAVHYSFPETGAHVDAFLDGTDAAVQGPLAYPSASVAVLEHGPRELEYASKRHGRVINVGNWQLSADGRTLIESYWVPSKPNIKEVLVYEKQ